MMSTKRWAAAAAGAAVLAATVGVAPSVAGPSAELIDVHHIMPAKSHGKGGGGGNGGKPQPSTANCSNDAPGSYTNSSVPTGWTVQGDLTAVFNTGGAPSGLGDLVSAAQAAFDAWAAPGVPTISVVGGGTATRPKANQTDELMFGRTGGSIATTYTWRWSNGFVESDVVFDKGLPWFEAASEGDGCYESQPRYDFSNIATHEFGHVYGLDHPSGARYETMYAYGYTGETLKRSPTPGEVSGLASLY